MPRRPRQYNGGPYIEFRKQVNRMIRTLLDERDDAGSVITKLQGVERWFLADEHRAVTTPAPAVERSSIAGEQGGGATT